LGERNIGHAGTLDPLASGLLVLLVGEATKISDYILNGEKAYQVRLRLGQTTDTLDRMGSVIQERTLRVESQDVNRAIEAAVGVLKLPVPQHSAVKVAGKKLYEYARAGNQIETPIREMDFQSVRCLEVSLPFADAEIRCSKGSFIRAWADYVGGQLGCGAHVSELRRVQSAPYAVDAALTLERLEELWSARPERNGRILGPAWVPLSQTLPGFRSLRIEGRDEVLMRNGQIANHLQMRLLSFFTLGETPPGVKVLTEPDGELLALLTAEPGRPYRIRRVFHQNS